MELLSDEERLNRELDADPGNRVLRYMLPAETRTRARILESGK